MAMPRLALILATSLFLTAMLLAQETGTQASSAKTISGSVIDHIVIQLAEGKFQRFLGPDLRLRQISYTVGHPSSQGQMVFSRQSALWKKLRGLQKKGEEFELVIYFLEQGQRQRVRCQGVRVLRSEEKRAGEKEYTLAWTAQSLEIEPVQESPRI